MIEELIDKIKSYYPKAYSFNDPEHGFWTIISDTDEKDAMDLGYGDSELEAWKDSLEFCENS